MDEEKMSELIADVQEAFDGTYEVWLGSTTINHANVEVDWEVVVQRLLEYGWKRSRTNDRDRIHHQTEERHR